MYGLLIENTIEFIKFKYGNETWLRIRDKSQIHEYAFVTHKMYSEKVIPRLAKGVQDITGDSETEFMREVGYDFVIFLSKYGYDRMLRVLGRSMRDFLNGLDNLHEYLRFSYPKMKPPSFFVTDESDEGLTLYYRTKRKGYTHYVQGQLMRVGKFFYNLNVDVTVLEEISSKESESGNHTVKFKLRFDNREFQEASRRMSKMNTLTSNVEISLPSQVIFEVFPFHVRFDSNMTITGTGESLRSVMPDLCGKNLTEAFELRKPLVPFKWKSIRSHENCVFDLQSQDLVIRNIETFAELSKGKGPGGNTALNGQNDAVEEELVPTEGDDMQKKISTVRPTNCACSIRPTDCTCTEILEDVFQPRRIRLKGQMRFVAPWGSYMFLATPMLPNLEAMFETGLFINDLSMHDSSRDLVLAGTQQSAELKLALDQEVQKSKQLEGSMRKLDLEMKRTDSLLYQMIPKSVADKLRRGEPATNTCEVFQEVTVLFSDVVGFTSICSRITPMQVVSMLNGMYTIFDGLSEQYEVYKVETIGDAYMVVGGAPVKTKLHAVKIAEMALAMVRSIVELADPSTGEAMNVRVGVHSGTVVAGVVGIKMPRYCLFGDTVNTASRMESMGKSQRIHMSQTTKDCLAPYEGYILLERSEIQVKGKGTMKTYWLQGKDHGATDHLALEGSRAMSRADSSDSENFSKRGSESRRVSLISSTYTPVSAEVSRAGTPLLPRELLEPSRPISTKRDSIQETHTPRNSMAVPPPKYSAKPGKKDVMNFGQINYGHENMQSFMDPAYAHGKLDGAKTPPYQMAKKLQARLQHHQEMVNSPDSPPHIISPSPRQNNNNKFENNGNGPQNDHMSSVAQLSPVPEKPKEHICPPMPRRVETTEKGTNTTTVKSSACMIL